MSQSDYIRRKKTSYVLYEPSDLNHVLSSQQLTNFKSVVMPNDIIYENEYLDPNIPVNQQRITGFDNGVTNVVDCPSFLFCKDTHLRENRKLGQMAGFNHRNYNGFNEFYWTQKKTGGT